MFFSLKSSESENKASCSFTQLSFNETIQITVPQLKRRGDSLDQEAVTFCTDS